MKKPAEIEDWLLFWLVVIAVEFAVLLGAFLLTAIVQS